MSQPLEDQSFGNLWSISQTIIQSEVEETSYHHLLGQLRNSVRKTDAVYVREVQNGGGTWII